MKNSSTANLANWSRKQADLIADLAERDRQLESVTEELKINKAMLARQTDLAREAEMTAMAAEADLAERDRQLESTHQLALDLAAELEEARERLALFEKHQEETVEEVVLRTTEDLRELTAAITLELEEARAELERVRREWRGNLKRLDFVQGEATEAKGKLAVANQSLREARAEAQRTAPLLAVVREKLDKAFKTAGGRWCEWGERAETVEAMLDELHEYLGTLPRARVLKGVVRQFHDKRAGYLKYIGVIRIRELPKPGTPVQVVIPGEVGDG